MKDLFNKILKIINHNHKNNNSTAKIDLNYPDKTMYELIEETAQKYPYNIAFEYFKNKATYRELINRIERVAASLKALGVVENDHVTICMPNTPSAIEMFYAVNKIGAISNMIHPLSSEKEIEIYLNTSHSKYLLTIDMACEKINNIIDNTCVSNVIISFPNDDMKPVMSSLYWFMKGRKNKIRKKENYYTWKQFLELGKNYHQETKCQRKKEDLALILYSGGTTGEPKGIMLSNLNFNAQALQCYIGCETIKEGDSVLAIMPIFHSFGLGVCIHTPLYIGMKVILVPTFSPKTLSTLIKRNKPNFLIGVPTLFEALLKNERKLKKNDLASISCVISGGDHLSIDLKKKVDSFLKEHGSNASVREGYGLTECSGASCLTPPNNYIEESIGLPFPDTHYKIVKLHTFEEADTLTDGEICINGPSVMLGYLNDDIETNKVLKIHDDNKIWLHTGDIGCMDKNGYVYFKQRLKRIIVSSGYNIYPSYIENIINSHPSVLTSTVIGIDHPYKVKVAKAIIVLKDNMKPTLEIKKSIKDHCAKNLAKYSIPYVFEYQKSIPKTLIGKTAYYQLEKQHKKNKKEKRKNENRKII